MQERTALIIDSVGLHARPATVAVHVASKFKSEIKISYKGRSSNMKSIIGLISLGVPTQSEVVITAEGEDEEEAIATIEETLRAQKIIE